MRRLLVALLACVVLSACDNSGDSSTIAPTVALTTDTFTGTVEAGQAAGIDHHSFTAAQQGELDVTLTAAGPPATIFMGLAVGSPSAADGTCTPLSGASTVTQAGMTPQLAGTVAAGTFCVTVWDVGNQTAAVSYTVTVAHP